MIVFAKFLALIDERLKDTGNHFSVTLRLIDFRGNVEQLFNDLWNGRRTKEWERKKK